MSLRQIVEADRTVSLPSGLGGQGLALPERNLLGGGPENVRQSSHLCMRKELRAWAPGVSADYLDPWVHLLVISDT